MAYSRDITRTYLAFKIGKELFAIPVSNVIVVLREQGITPVPKTSAYVNGIIQFRGGIISVVSAKTKLNVPVAGVPEKPVVIVVEFETDNKESKLGLQADKVIGVLDIPENEIKPVMEFGNYYNPEFLKGVFKHKNDIISILDISRIFSAEEINIINDVKTEHKE